MWLSFLGMVVQTAEKVVDWTSARQTDLIAAIIKGDEGAFAWLVRRHWGGMMNVSRGILGNESLASEVVQETWEVVFRELKGFRGDSSLSTWIFRILINRARRTGKKEARCIPFSGIQGFDESGGSLEDEFTARGKWRSPVHGWRFYDPQQEAINREGIRFLAKGLEKLPEKQRVVVSLRDVEGFDSDDVCEMLGLSRANQRQLLHRGRTGLRRMLEVAEREHFHGVTGEGVG
jgi:RNA polymerase sigma-70 factor (ECF subfamily)